MASTKIGRSLFGAPVLWQDWDDQVEEGAASYWELFVDLLMVAAASSVADLLVEEPTAEGFAEFCLFYLVNVNGWMFYVHHYTARFEDSSLMHTFVLFFFMLGMAAGIVNTSLETARAFCLAVSIQRVAFLAMIAGVGICLTRARETVTVLAIIVLGGLFCLLMGALRPDDWAVYALTVAAVWEYCTEVIMISLLPGTRLVPINIEHTKERLGVLVLIMLGETVISTTITYREYASESRYYTVLILAFLLIFMFSLLYFNVQPAPEDHALRRSRVIGTLCMLLNKTLGLFLLCIGVCIKLAIKQVVAHDTFSPFMGQMFGIAVGCSLLLLFAMRLCHYGGKLPRPNDPPTIQRLMYIWWAFFGMACLVPFCFLWIRNPARALTLYSSLVLVLCVVESWFTDVLELYLPGGGGVVQESDTLLHPGVDTYESVITAISSK